MPRRVFIVHGFEGNPHGNWFDWLSAQVRAAGFQADALAMPNPERPTVSSWQFALSPGDSPGRRRHHIPAA